MEEQKPGRPSRDWRLLTMAVSEAEREAFVLAAVDEIRRHYLPTGVLQNDRDITAAAAGVPKDCRQPVTFRRYERLRALMRRLIKIMLLTDIRCACTAEQL
jgi:hypothetical protein